ncbi:hypothetical protein FF38_00550 [Lucilia cuprina]|uniref:Uncharacterized protein n=1 Tax=Lucilia cuprina TaxID=7375 RepID=A0A0L0CL04_LUCCU|nr:uncharacterized protein LOC111687623 [Lucilia cuprina]KAI8122884.1 hypothetical protein CVS40_6486 [Lucilia cuprina]KNC32907.1 hypothetical protein FF38_00550 [Lucilia cuprina]
MSGLIDKRKRSREDDVLCESTPLSKRINNLHLSNFEEAQYNQQLQNTNAHHNNNHLQHLTKDMMTAESSALKPMTADKNMYEPELDESQNPFYYVKNKLLHDLHLERMKRCSV